MRSPSKPRRAVRDRFAILGRIERMTRPIGTALDVDHPARRPRPAIHVSGAAREVVARRRHARLALARGAGTRHSRRPARRTGSWRSSHGWPSDTGVEAHLDHFGVRRGNLDEAAFASLPEVLALAKYPNVAIKATGGPQYVSDPFPFVSLQDRYHAIHDAFRPAAHVLGHGHHAHALLLARLRDRLRRASAVAAPEDLPWIMGARDRAVDWLGAGGLVLGRSRRIAVPGRLHSPARRELRSTVPPLRGRARSSAGAGARCATPHVLPTDLQTLR